MEPRHVNVAHMQCEIWPKGVTGSFLTSLICSTAISSSSSSSDSPSEVDSSSEELVTSLGDGESTGLVSAMRRDFASLTCD